MAGMKNTKKMGPFKNPPFKFKKGRCRGVVINQGIKNPPYICIIKNTYIIKNTCIRGNLIFLIRVCKKI
jgi:hypothetical protein